MGKEIDGDQRLQMVFQERSPCLARGISTAGHILANAGFADVDAQFEEFAVDARAPQSGLSRLICRMSWRVSAGTAGRPGWPSRDLHVQNRRRPFRCHPITV